MKKVTEGLLRYYSIRQLHYHPKAKLTLLYSVVSLLQSLAMMIPPAEQPGYQWNYDLFWPVYYIINAVGRPDRLLVLATGDTDVLTYLLLGLIAGRVFIICMGIITYLQVNNNEFILETSQRRKDCISSIHFRANVVAIFIVSRVLAVPIVGGLAEAIGCFPACPSGFFRGVLICGLVVIVTVVLVDRVYTVDLKWRKYNEGPITPVYEAVTVGTDLVAAMVVPLYPLSTHDFLFRAISVSCCVLKLSAIYRDLPYHSLRRNTVESLKGVILLWQVILLTLSRNLSRPSVAPDLILFLGLPLLFILNLTIVKSRERSMHEGDIDSEAKHAKSLQSYLHNCTPRTPAADTLSSHPLLKHFPLGELNLYPSIWTIYYFIHTEETYFMKITMSGLKPQLHKSLLSEVAASVCLLRAHIKLEEDSDELSMQRFLAMQKVLEELQNLDYISTALLRDFDESLGRKTKNFTRLTLLARRLSINLEHITDLYQYAMVTFPKKATVLQAYTTFLEMIGRPKKAAKVANEIAKLKSSRRKRDMSAADRLLIDDPKCAAIVVPFSGRNAYKIQWTVNANLLGYTDKDLIGTDFHILIPSCFHEKHDKMMKSLLSRRSVPMMFQGANRMMVVNKDRQLMQGSWKIFAAVDRMTGDFTAVATLKVEKPSREFGLLDVSDHLAELTQGFAAFTRNSSFLATADLSSREVVWKGEWNTHSMLVAREKWQLADRVEVPCLALFRLGGKAVKSANLRTPSLLDIQSSQTSNTQGMDTSNTQFLSRISQHHIVETMKSYSTAIGRQNHSKFAYQLGQAKRRIRKCKKYLFCLVVLTLLFGAVVMLTITEIFSLSVLNLSASTGIITVNRLRSLSVASAMYSKELYLVGRQFPLYGNETQARERLKELAGSEFDLRSILYGNISFASEGLRRVLLEPVNAYWRYEHTEFTFYSVSLMDMMDEISRRAQALAQAQLAEINEKNDDFMTLYRNGAAEFLRAFNHATHEFGQSYAQEEDQLTTSLQLLAAFGPFSCLIASICSAVIILTLLESWRRFFWTRVLSLPHSIVLNSLEIIYDRLSNLHQEDRLATVVDTPSRRQVQRYSCEKSFIVLFVVLIVFCAGMSLSGLCIFYYGMATMGTELADKAEYLDYLKQRGSLLLLCQFLMREVWLSGPESYSALVPEQQTFTDLLESWERHSAQALDIENCFEYGCAGGIHTLFPSATHIDLLCDGRDFNDIPLKAGIRPLLHEYFYYSSFVRSVLLQGVPTTYSSGRDLERYVSLLTSALAASIQQFDSDTQDTMEQGCSWMLVSSVIVVVVGGLVAFGCICPLVLQVTSI